MKNNFLNADALRQMFSSAMSDMYKQEVPAYQILINLVEQGNETTLSNNSALLNELDAADGLKRITEERHGAIRVGTKDELNTIRRIFAIMGMFPVGYYDLSVANIPVHSTAFRPISKISLSKNPFRIFTSLLRLELIDDDDLRQNAEKVLSKRKIFSPKLIDLLKKVENAGGISVLDAKIFIKEVINIFRWHSEAQLSSSLYNKFHDAHRLIADIVSFKGPHINHLTPRSLDIEQAQRAMPRHGITPKAVIEGPPERKCPILLRQTSFKALVEPIKFSDEQGENATGTHTARFGEIEQRGVALTQKGRDLYDNLLTKARNKVLPNPDGSNATVYYENLTATFQEFPDDWDALRKQKLAFFQYHLTDEGKALTKGGSTEANIETLLENGLVNAFPIIYEDFLPVSAAGIFQSNLGDNVSKNISKRSNQNEFETALGAKVLNELDNYQTLEHSSIAFCLNQLKSMSGAS